MNDDLKSAIQSIIGGEVELISLPGPKPGFRLCAAWDISVSVMDLRTQSAIMDAVSKSLREISSKLSSFEVADLRQERKVMEKELTELKAQVEALQVYKTYVQVAKEINGVKS